MFLETVMYFMLLNINFLNEFVEPSLTIHCLSSFAYSLSETLISNEKKQVDGSVIRSK